MTGPQPVRCGKSRPVGGARCFKDTVRETGDRCRSSARTMLGLPLTMTFEETPRGEDDVMNAIIGLLAVSTLAGLVLGLRLLERHPNKLYFGLAALIIAISAAAILQNINFGFLEGIAIIVLCLTVNQIAYLIGDTLASRGPEDQ